VEKPLRPFMLMDNDAFAKLSTAEKAEYIQQAREALQRGAPVVTSNIKDVAGTPDYLKKP
jgi:hypothetical protein